LGSSTRSISIRRIRLSTIAMRAISAIASFIRIIRISIRKL
jgi:hypothetical protein